MSSRTCRARRRLQSIPERTATGAASLKALRVALATSPPAKNPKSAIRNPK